MACRPCVSPFLILNSSIASRGKWGYFVPRRNPVHNSEASRSENERQAASYFRWRKRIFWTPRCGISAGVQYPVHRSRPRPRQNAGSDESRSGRRDRGLRNCRNRRVERSRKMEVVIVTTLRVPKTGGIPTTKVIVVKWLKRKGQKVRLGEAIVELHNNKVKY